MASRRIYLLTILCMTFFTCGAIAHFEEANVFETAIWAQQSGTSSPRKPYAQDQAFLQISESVLDGNHTGGTLFERQYNLQCASASGQQFYCERQCCNGQTVPGCCNGNDTCLVINGQHQCCPTDKGYVTCGGTTCVWGICCDTPGKACQGLSRCCPNGGCCDSSETCCGDQCCLVGHDCCDGVCCDRGYFCSSAGRCAARQTSAATTTIRETVTAAPNGAGSISTAHWGFGVLAFALMSL